ncbi:periplasmic solute binding protein [Methylobacterium sp. 4-46]|nr:periplasmic solute binding protein [Methylobacterium sp. 4-46]
MGSDRNLRRLGALALLVLPLLLCPAAVRAAQGGPVRVVATTPDLKSLVEAVGGDAVVAASLVPPGADPEAYEVRPGDLLGLRGADLVVRVGLGYDHWLDPLLARHADPKLMRGGAGQVDASAGIPLLEVLGSSVEAGATGGHAHGLANPHYWLDPANAETITAGIADGLARVAPGRAALVAENRGRFLAGLARRLASWQARLAPYAGAPVVAYHNDWPYFARRFRLNVVAVVEPKEGIAPSPAQLARVAGLMREQGVRVVLAKPNAPRGPAEAVAARTGARVVVLAGSVGELSGTGDYLGLFEVDVDVLHDAFEAGGR